MTDFLKIAKSIAFHFAHICAYGVETVKERLPSRTRDVDKPHFSVLCSGPVEQECGCNGDHLSALTLAVTIYFKGIGNDKTSHVFSCFCFSLSAKPNIFQ